MSSRASPRSDRAPATLTRLSRPEDRLGSSGPWCAWRRTAAAAQRVRAVVGRRQNVGVSWWLAGQSRCPWAGAFDRVRLRPRFSRGRPIGRHLDYVTRFGFVSTFPPTQCGLATFTTALRSALLHSSTDEGWVVRLVDAPAPRPGDEVVAQLIAGDSASLRRAAEQLNLCDVAIVQHEYGVSGGADGSEILHLLDQVRVPCVVVLHTVLTDPLPHQRQVLESVIAKAAAVVTMTMAASNGSPPGTPPTWRRSASSRTGRPSWRRRWRSRLSARGSSPS